MPLIYYLICFSLIPIIYFISRYFPKNNDKIFCIISGVVVFILLVNIPLDIRADYPIYSEGYVYISNLSFKEICSGFHVLKRFDLPWPFVFESGFVVIIWAFSHLGINFAIWTMIYSAVVVIVISYFIYEYSANHWISYLLWMSFYLYGTTGRYRQTLALLFVIVSLEFIRRKKIIPFVVLIGLAFLIHQSAFIIFPLYFLNKIKLNRQRYFCLLILFPSVAFLIGNVFMSKILVLFGYVLEKHPIFFSINNRILMIIVFCFIAFCTADFRRIEIDETVRMIYWGTLILLGLCVFGAYEDMVSRSAEYYFIFFIVFVPHLLLSYKKNARLLLNIALFVALGVFYANEIANSSLIGINSGYYI